MILYMKDWPIHRFAAVVYVATLAGCAGPQISVTDAAPRRVAFLVRNAPLVPIRDVDEQAASHCQRHGLSYRRTDIVWISPTLKQVTYRCDGVGQLQTRKRQAGSQAAAKSAVEDPKAAAWTKAKAATHAWALCLRLDAERKAKDATEAPQTAAQEVVDACSELEHAVHEPLEAVDEDLDRFQAELHAQAVQNASDMVTSIRIKAGIPVARSSEY